MLERLIKTCDVLVENFAPGALDRMGLTWAHIQSINPRMIVASVKGFGPGPYEDCKVYENVAQCTGGAASTTGFRDGLPLVTGAQIGDFRHGPAPRARDRGGLVPARDQRARPEGARRHAGRRPQPLPGEAARPAAPRPRAAQGIQPVRRGRAFGDATPRAGNDSGGGQPGRIVKCKGWETDPNAYLYFITQAPVWEKICDVIGEPDWKTNPDYAKPAARLPRLNEIFGRIEQWTMTMTKFEAMDLLNEHDIPCGPILSMKEIAQEPSLRATGTIVEVDHPERGPYLSVGNPIKLSDSPTEVTRSPLLGEHTDEILRDVLGYNDNEIAEIANSGATGASAKMAAE